MSKKTVSVFMDPQLRDLLKDVAKKTNRSFSYVVSFFCIKGVNDYVAESKIKEPSEEQKEQ